LGYPITPRWISSRSAEIRQLGSQYLPLLFSVGIASACVLVDQSVAARLGPGQVSALVYGNRLSMVVLQVVATPVGITMLPMLSRIVAVHDWGRLRRAVLLYCAAALLIVVPLTAALIAGSDVLVRVFFQRGAFRSDAATLVAHVQRFSLLQAPFALLVAIVSRLATALSANILLARMGIAALIADVVLDFTLSRRMGVAGIAFANAFVQFFSLVLLTFLLYRRKPNLFKGNRLPGGC
jgi:putative peptidoglycan lipid II flippase